MAVNQENTQYSYEVMAPHESFRGIAVPLVVRTDNPDPDTFRLLLKDSEGNVAEACMDDVYDPGFPDIEVRSSAGAAQGGYVFFFTARHSEEYSVYIQEKSAPEEGTPTGRKHFCGVIAGCTEIMEEDSAYRRWIHSVMELNEEKEEKKAAVRPRAVLHHRTISRKIIPV